MTWTYCGKVQFTAFTVWGVADVERCCQWCAIELDNMNSKYNSHLWENRTEPKMKQKAFQSTSLESAGGFFVSVVVVRFRGGGGGGGGGVGEGGREREGEGGGEGERGGREGTEAGEGGGEEREERWGRKEAAPGEGVKGRG